MIPKIPAHVLLARLEHVVAGLTFELAEIRGLVSAETFANLADGLSDAQALIDHLREVVE